MSFWIKLNEAGQHRLPVVVIFSWNNFPLWVYYDIVFTFQHEMSVFNTLKRPDTCERCSKRLKERELYYSSSSDTERVDWWLLVCRRQSETEPFLKKTLRFVTDSSAEGTSHVTAVLEHLFSHEFMRFKQHNLLQTSLLCIVKTSSIWKIKH